MALRVVAASSGAALTAGLSALRPGRRQRAAEAEVLAARPRLGGLLNYYARAA